MRQNYQHFEFGSSEIIMIHCFRGTQFIKACTGRWQDTISGWIWKTTAKDMPSAALHAEEPRRIIQRNRDYLNHCLYLIENGPISVGHVDFLPKCRIRGRLYQDILITVDRLTKWRLYESMTSLDTEELVDAMRRRVFSSYGLPTSFVNDRGSLWKLLLPLF